MRLARLRRLVRPALRALAAHRLRVALALSGVALGVASLLLTSALGRGAESEMARGLDRLGTDLLVVRPAAAQGLSARKEVRGPVTTLSLADAEALAELDRVAEILPGIDRPLRVKAGSTALVTSVLGTTPAFPRVRRFRLRAGRFFDPEDDRAARRVAVLGSRVAERLFDGDDPVGRPIRLRGVPFEVVGVLESRGAQSDGSDEDNLVAIPIRTALRRVFNVTWISTVFVRVRDPRRMDEARAEIADLLRERHGLAGTAKPDDFAVQARTKILASRKEAAETLTLLTGGLSVLALLVGGVGVLALMLTSVKERTGEIGLRLAVGARPRDILFQFLAEATALALGGWLAGAALGGLGVAALALGTEWKVGLPSEALLASLAMVLILGLGFGAFPARQASLLPPIQALGAD